AHNYCFKLSFPCNNDFGFIYEPWHWCYHNDKC
ncbi:D-alanyl-D-alanine carboxypeptidase family protein, partial [Francisella tularensis subsp. holarctica]